jgi:CBS domain-containing protein
MEKCAKNKIFLAYMAGNALTHQPPVGFFRNFVLIRGGDHNHTLDMKHTGVVPIIDLARVYALSAGVKTVNTHERLMQAMERKAISQDGAMDLRDALEFISLTRLRHQARKIRAGEKADNYLEPEALSSFERSHLKDAFGVVKTMQAAMANTYQAGRF